MTKRSVTLLFSIVVVCDLSAVRGVAEYHVDASSGMIVDSLGRARIFHGLNVVMKAPPWHPRTDLFDPHLSFADADIALLRSWGLNVVRLGVMWPGVEPQRGQVNQTYIEIIQTLVRKLHAAGLVTLLEFHQDLFSSRFCGEGIPSWVLDNSDLGGTKKENSRLLIADSSKALRNADGSKARDQPKSFIESFPEPLSGRWPLGPDSPGDHDSQQQPSEEQCDKHPWASYYFSFAVSQAFQSLYENKWGWADLFARYWQIVAASFCDQPGVLGYELINEPWAGDLYHNPLLLVPGVADHHNLAPFYEKLQMSIRSVDPDSILFMETVTFEDVRCGFSDVPGGSTFQNRTVLSYHYYRPPNFMPRQTFRERLRESKKLGCGAMLTEFFVADQDEEQNTRYGSNSNVDAVLAEADAHQQSWIGWEYKAFQNKTGSVVQQSLFTSSGEVNLGLAKKLARTYPQAVMGSILSFSFDPVSSDFSLSFVAGQLQGRGEDDSHCTQVFVHRPFYYPSGLEFSVNFDCIQVQETERLILLRHSQACVGLRIAFTIRKTPIIRSS